MRNKQMILLVCIILVSGILLSSLSVLATSQKVYDDASLFSEVQKETLHQQASQLSEKLVLHIAIVTTEDNHDKTSQAYANDFYNDNGFGYGDDADGVLLLIDMANREVYILTQGVATTYLTQARIESMLDKIYPHLSGENYTEAANVFLNELENYIQQGLPANEVQDDLTKRIVIYLLISFAVGAITVGIMAMNNKGKIGTNENTYLDPSSFKMLHAQDRHINTSLTHVTINTSSGSSGSGKSGGGGRGGGGRKF